MKSSEYREIARDMPTTAGLCKIVGTLPKWAIEHCEKGGDALILDWRTTYIPRRGNVVLPKKNLKFIKYVMVYDLYSDSCYWEE